MSAPIGRPSHLERTALAACIVLAGLAILRTFVWMVPALRFDVDPAADPWPAAGWGPAQALTVDSCSLLLTAFVYWVCAARTRIADAVVACAALLPAVAVVIHGSCNGDDAWRGVGWLSAFLSAAALWTAVRTLPKGPALRASLLAVLLAVAGPLLLCSAAQLFVEHPNTVAEYQDHKASILAARGWTADSPQALMFERRLMQAEATGWFGLSNVLSSFVAAMAVALGGLALVGWRHLERGTALVLAAAAVGCVAVVGLNGSKGAIGALGIGLVAAVVARQQRPMARWASLLGVTAVAGVVFAVVIRGAMGESWEERSLLFRWQYLQGALSAWWVEPLFGTGPSGFAQAYLFTRPARAPEEVISAHSMWVDWLAALGVAGIAWTCVVVGWLWTFGRTLGGSVSTAHGGVVREAPATASRKFLLVSIGTVVAACLLGSVVEFHTLDASGIALRGVGMALAVILVVAVLQTLEIPTRSAAAALFGAAVVLIAHAQIEMTLWNASSVGWVLAFVSVSASGGGGEPGTRVAPRDAWLLKSALRLSAIVCVALSAATMNWGVMPAMKESAVMEQAAQPIAAFYAAGRSDVRAVPTGVRASAADALAREDGLGAAWGVRPLRLAASLHQWISALAAMAPDSPLYSETARRALHAASAVVQRSSADAVLSAAQGVAQLAARSSHPELAQEANESLARFAQLQLNASPRNVIAWINLGRACEAQEQHAAARDAYLRALQADDSYALDSLRQLRAADRADLERRAHSTDHATEP